MPHLRDILAGLAAHEPTRLPRPPSPHERASVALVLAGPPDDLALCMIRRAERDDDPWSGHMALPGGRAHVTDPSALAVARRETAEEVGLHLTDAHFVAELDDTRLRPDKPSQAVLSAFAFHLGPRRPSLAPEPSEVADAHWVPLAHLWDPAQTTTMPWTHRGQALTFPGIAYGDHIVWGLTLRVLFRFGEVVGHPLPLPTDAPKIHLVAKSSGG